MKTIPFAQGLPLPMDAVTQRLAFLGRTGQGKSHAVGKLVEGFLHVGVQVVILEDDGTWWGLRLAADGKSPGYKIPVFGGLRGDIPLQPDSGHLVADLIVDMGISAVVDVSDFSKNKRKIFVAEFAERLFQRRRRSPAPMHLVIEESQKFIPQRVPKGLDARVVGAVEDIVKQGRKYGIGVSLITTRPQAVNKDALNQTECLIVFQTVGAHERKAIRDWIVEQGVDKEAAIESLPSLAVGEAYIWSPQWLCTFRKVRMLRKKTYDSSKTPEFGKRATKARVITPVDVDKIRESMAKSIQKSQENDPRILLSRIRDLEVALAREKRSKTTIGTPVEIEVKIPTPIFRPADKEVLEHLVAMTIPLGVDLQKWLKSSTGVVQILRARLKEAEKAAVAPVVRTKGRVAVHKVTPHKGEVEFSLPAEAPSNGVKLRRGEKRMIETIMRYAPRDLTRAQLGTLSRFPAGGSTFKTYLGVLKRKDLITEEGGRLQPTGVARTQFAYVPPAPVDSGPLLDEWCGALRAGEAKMLRILADGYPGAMDKDHLGAESGFPSSGSTFKTYLGVLKRNGLIEAAGGEVRASGSLFLQQESP